MLHHLCEDPRFRIDLFTEHTRQLQKVGAEGKDKEFRPSSLTFIRIRIVFGSFV
jgi:hypothetical protein